MSVMCIYDCVRGVMGERTTHNRMEQLQQDSNLWILNGGMNSMSGGMGDTSGLLSEMGERMSPRVICIGCYYCIVSTIECVCVCVCVCLCVCVCVRACVCVNEREYEKIQIRKQEIEIKKEKIKRCKYIILLPSASSRYGETSRKRTVIFLQRNNQSNKK